MRERDKSSSHCENNGAKFHVSLLFNDGHMEVIVMLKTSHDTVDFWIVKVWEPEVTA